jgi:TonB family protein
MTLNTQNSLLISSFLHLLFIAAFIALPKPEYTVRQLTDISFLFSTIEKEPQANNPEDKPVLKSKAGPMKTAYQKDSRQAGMTEIPPNPPLAKGGEGGFAGITSTQKLEELKALSEPLKENEIHQAYQKAYSPLVETAGMPIKQKTETLTYGAYESSASGTSDLPSSYASTAKGEGISDIKPSGFGGSKDTAASAHAGTTIDKSAIISSFVDRIESLKHYPYIARRRGIQGTALIFVHLNKNGELKDVVLRKSSGHEILDKSAVELIKKATPFRHGYHSDLKIEIPITYKLIR